MEVGGGGNGVVAGGGGMIADERKGAGGRLELASNGQTAGFHNSQGEGGGMRGGMRFRTPDGRMVEIRNVWSDNLEREMVAIRELVERYPFVAMDTEFPGVVARPVGDFNQPDYQYQTLRCNVDMLKIIQLGLSFVDENGHLPEDGCCAWQFNFTFNLSEDMYAHDSIQLLKNSGIDFEAHERRGIDLQHFGELLMTSGLVLMPNVTWLSFHSGYDFGYLLKLLTCNNLPQQESDFFDLLQLYFPKIYDIKFLVSSQNGFHGGLNKLAEELKVERIGPIHQAGSDSLLTEQVFLKVADVFFNGVGNLDKGKFKGKFLGQLYGYGGNQTGIFRPANKPGLHNNGGAAGAAPGANGNGASPTGLAMMAGAVTNNSNINGNSSTNRNDNGVSTNAAASAALDDVISSTPGRGAAAAVTTSTSGSASAPAVGDAATVSPAGVGTPVDTSVTVASGARIGDPASASAGNSNLAAAGGAAPIPSGDVSPGQDGSAAGAPSATGGLPGTSGHGLGAPSS